MTHLKVALASSNTSVPLLEDDKVPTSFEEIIFAAADLSKTCWMEERGLVSRDRNAIGPVTLTRGECAAFFGAVADC